MTRQEHIFHLTFPLLAVCFLQAVGTPHAHASAPYSQAAPTPYDGSSYQARARHPYQSCWGRYTILIDWAGDLNRLRVLDAVGHVQREVRAEDILTVDYPVLRPGHPPALRVMAAAGGVAESSERTYLFANEHGVRNVLVFTGEITQIMHQRDDGMADLVADSSVPLEYFTGFSHYGCGNVMLVLGWNGGRYVLVNRLYPWLARQRAQSDRRKLQVASSSRDDSEQVGAAIGACANLWTLNEGSGYYHWLRAHLTRTGWKWFMRAQPELRRRMLAVSQMASVSQGRVLVLPEN